MPVLYEFSQAQRSRKEHSRLRTQCHPPADPVLPLKTTKRQSVRWRKQHFLHKVPDCHAVYGTRWNKPSLISKISRSLPPSSSISAGQRNVRQTRPLDPSPGLHIDSSSAALTGTGGHFLTQGTQVMSSACRRTGNHFSNRELNHVNGSS